MVKLKKMKYTVLICFFPYRYKAYMESNLADQTVTSLFNESHAKLVERNRSYLKIIADTLRLTAVQNIAQRGHRESTTDDDNNRGNSLEILSFMKNYSEILEDRLENGPQNAKYTHHTIQDAILEIFSDIILDEITKEIKEAEYFALLVDETKDLSKQEQITFVLRYVFECEVREEFLNWF